MATQPVLVTAASTRRGSLNAALAHEIVGRLRGDGVDAAYLDLAEHPLPLYHGDLEVEEGVPEAAHELAGRLSAASSLVIVSPEYNGAFSPLLKNTVDWVSRADRAALAHLRILLAAASPGGGGGARGLELARTWLTSMRLDVEPTALVVRGATLQDGVLEGERSVPLEQFLAPLAATSLASCA